VIPFLRSFAFGLGIFSIFLGVAGKVYGVGNSNEIFWAIGTGVAALALRFTVFRHRAPKSAK
jgi:hypothetical protein